MDTPSLFQKQVFLVHSNLVLRFMAKPGIIPFQN